MNLQHRYSRFAFLLGLLLLGVVATVAFGRNASNSPRRRSSRPLPQIALSEKSEKSRVIATRAPQELESLPDASNTTTDPELKSAAIVKKQSRNTEGRLDAEWEELAEPQTFEFVGRVVTISAHRTSDNRATVLLVPISGTFPNESVELLVKREDGSIRYRIEIGRLYFQNEYNTELSQLGGWCADLADPLTQGDVFAFEFTLRVKQGAYRGFNNDGSIRVEGQYANGKPSGEWLTYYCKDCLEKAETYSEGLLNGPYCQWYGNGVLACTGQYNRGKRCGLWKSYQIDNGSIRSESNWQDGQLQGPFQTWYDGGSAEITGSFSKGKRDGNWCIRSETGEVCVDVKFEDGSPVRKLIRDEEVYEEPMRLYWQRIEQNIVLPVIDRDPEAP